MILVTGGTGVLGAQLLYDLIQENDRVRVLYRSEAGREKFSHFVHHFSPETADLLLQRVEWRQGDILDIPTLEHHVTGCSQVYHCAALVSFHPSDFHRMMKINREGTANVVNVALGAGVQKLCYVSSTAAIGGDTNETITEKTPWKNTPTTTGYSISKYSAEKEVWRGIEEGLNAVMVNPCVILGAGWWEDSSLSVLKTSSKGMRHYPPGANAIVDARDVSLIMRKLMNSTIHSERYLCIGSNQSFKHLMTTIAEATQTTPPKIAAKRWQVTLIRRIMRLGSIFSGKRPSLTKETVNAVFGTRVYDASKVKSALGIEFYSLEDTIDFAVKHRLGGTKET